MDHYVDSKCDRITHRRRELHYLIGPGCAPHTTPPTRSPIVAYSEASARRLRRYIENYYSDFTGLITLTYGADYPTDGRIVKRHLAAFFERLNRLGWLGMDSLVWWLEFQERGAPHIHMVVTGWLSKAWLSKAWSAASGADVRTSTRIETLVNPDRVGIYAAKYAAKWEQKDVPAGFINVGRFWGRRGRRPDGGGKLIPKEVAASKIAARSDLRARVCVYMRPDGSPSDIVQGATSIRAVEHEGGWSFYGSEREIESLWHYLQDHNAGHVRGAAREGSTPPKTWRGSPVTPYVRESQEATLCARCPRDAVLGRPAIVIGSHAYCQMCSKPLPSPLL